MNLKDKHTLDRNKVLEGSHSNRTMADDTCMASITVIHQKKAVMAMVVKAQ
jgi:hypothetical protein